MVQTGGPAETVMAMATGKAHAAAITSPATLQARKLKLKELLDMSKLDAEYHINGVLQLLHQTREHCVSRTWPAQSMIEVVVACLRLLDLL
jgi:hypothetical protein